MRIDKAGSVRRCGIIRRVIVITDILQSSRFGQNLDYVVREVNDRTGEAYCERTIRRDLEMFELVKVARRIGPASWAWNKNQRKDSQGNARN
jgi:arginine repressor